MIKLEHNFDIWAKELHLLSEKQFNGIFKRSMTRALKKGRATARTHLRTKMRGTKGKTWNQYFNDKTDISSVTGMDTQFEGHIKFSSKQHGLASYTTKARLLRHRKRMSEYAFGKGRKKPAKALQFDMIPGKKTKLKRAFAGKGSSGGQLQVFRRSKSGSKLSRPLGPSLAQQMRSSRNNGIRFITEVEMRKTYFKEFKTALDFKLSRIRSRVRSARF